MLLSKLPKQIMVRSVNSDTFILHGYWQSSSTHRVRIALNLKQIKYTKNIVSVINNDNNTNQQYIQLNPMQAVPTLQHIYTDTENKPHTNTITQSVAIIEYLDAVKPDAHPLLSTDPYQAAQIRSVVQIIASDVQPLHNVKILRQIETLSSAEQTHQFVHNVLNRGLRAVEHKLQHTAGKYCFGDSVSMADIYLAGCMQSTRRFKLDTTSYPICNRIDTELNKLDEFIDAHPLNQTDYAERTSCGLNK